LVAANSSVAAASGAGLESRWRGRTPQTPNVQYELLGPLRVLDENAAFGGLDASQRAAFEHIRNLVMDMVPEAEQGTSYGMAALKYKQKPLLAFLAAKHHLSVFPLSSQVIDAVRDRLTGFELSKGTIRFTVAMPLPDEVVRDIVRHRIEEIVGAAR
jgi:uncharacterized protein YdhG (YjbR/CyaY superfamily)